ncbi:alpha/beta hydrolase fold domain-containing protein [Halosquirtibacter xylanolyticus]|uniref:alpha/beta hydrolase fold domain-containing protein n=1 Tax=Halosquirtibacter xylanolyticus TaxID=3374599 RepID=UPI003748216C|nr:alpha/beta hydrolase fold domain-containing protein [Prolixibacteraceae bacterium]
MKYLSLFMILFCITVSVKAVNYAPDKKICYKQTKQGELYLHAFYPENYSPNDHRPAAVFFFGGGWVGGNPKQFYQQATHLTKLGFVCFSAEYRVKRFHKTTPFECVEDGKSAIRWVRKHASELGVNPNMIVAGGGSAGGHVAACTGVIKGHEAKGEDLTISSVPNAMILFNPVLDTTTKGYGAEKVKGREREISPCHQVHKSIPPTIIFQGTDDHTTPFENAARFDSLMFENKNRCTLIPIVGKDHGFFNSSYFRKKNTDDDYNYTMYQSEIFLWKLGYISEPSKWSYNFNSDLIYAPLQSLDYHQIRRGLKNSQIKFIKDKTGTVAFLGGSITFNKGWRNMICDYLKKKFPQTEFTFIEAGIPSEGSTSGAFRLDRDILSKGSIDLLFEEAAVNDRSPALNRSSNDRVRGMEGIVRHAMEQNPDIDIVMMHLVDPRKMDDYRNGKIPQEIVDHESVAKHYKIGSINLAKEVTDRIDHKEFTWENDFKNLHPSPFGQQVYFNSMKQFLESCYSGSIADDDKVTIRTIPTPLDAQCYSKGEFISIESAKLKKGWVYDQSWSPKKGERIRKGYSNIPVIKAANSKGYMSLDFEGRAIGINVMSGPDAGKIEYSIDKGPYQTFDLFTSNSHYQHLPRYFVLDASLSNKKKHNIRIRVSEDHNKNSKGYSCRIYSFFVNQ